MLVNTCWINYKNTNYSNLGILQIGLNRVWSDFMPEITTGKTVFLELLFLL
jgi:hypothetical protein